MTNRKRRLLSELADCAHDLGEGRVSGVEREEYPHLLGQSTETSRTCAAIPPSTVSISSA
jgi:hypothetical protein